VQKLLSSIFLSININIKIQRTITWPLVFYGCETWSLSLREECRFRVSENSVMMRIFGSKRDEITREWRSYITRSFIICTPDLILFRSSNQE